MKTIIRGVIELLVVLAILLLTVPAAMVGAVGRLLYKSVLAGSGICDDFLTYITRHRRLW